MAFTVMKSVKIYPQIALHWQKNGHTDESTRIQKPGVKSAYSLHAPTATSFLTKRPKIYIKGKTESSTNGAGQSR